jgi:hypothetical protein
MLPYCCQDPSSMIVVSTLFIGFAGKIESRRADSNRFPAHYEFAVTCCWTLQGFANPAYPKGFSFSTLLRVAPYCAPGGIRVVSQ